MAGPVLASPAATVSKPFKQPFKAVAQFSHKTGTFTKPIDPAISKSLDFIYNGITVRACVGAVGVLVWCGMPCHAVLYVRAVVRMNATRGLSLEGTGHPSS